MKNKPKVTVIIPVLNTVSYIRECIDSVLNQTLQDIEVFAVDAASTDGTHEILMEYAANDERVSLLDDVKHSTGYAKNLGIAMANAPYVTFVEPDDYIEPDMMEKLYNKAEETGADIVKGGFNTFIGDRDKRFVFPKSVALRQGDYDRLVKPVSDIRVFRWIMFEWLGIYRKDFLDKYHIRHQETAGAAFQDIGFWFIGFSYASNVYLMRDTMYHYRADNPNASVKNREKAFNTCGEYEYIKSSLEAVPEIWNKVEKAYYQAYYQSNFVVYDRLIDSLKPALSAKMHLELSRADSNGKIDLNLFDVDVREAVKTLIKSAEEFDALWRKKETDIEKNFADFLKQISSFKNPVIYGAGSYGSNLHYLLDQSGIAVPAYADSDRNKQAQKHNGLKILSASDCESQFPGCVYLVSSMLHTDEIIETLKAMGIEGKRIFLCDIKSFARLI